MTQGVTMCQAVLVVKLYNVLFFSKFHNGEKGKDKSSEKK